jgi:hypothetical protein
VASLLLSGGIWLAGGSVQWPRLRIRGCTLRGQSLDVATRFEMATMVVSNQWAYRTNHLTNRWSQPLAGVMRVLIL